MIASDSAPTRGGPSQPGSALTLGQFTEPRLLTLRQDEAALAALKATTRNHLGALRGRAISDFPLSDKSFNLSHCGFDR